MSRVLLLTARPNADGMMNGHKMWTEEKRPPNGLGYLKAVLDQAGHECEIADRYAANKGWWDKENWWPENGYSDYDLAGIYTCSVCTDDIAWLLNNIECDRIAVGGPHAFLYPEWFDAWPRVKVVRGEGENIVRLMASPEAWENTYGHGDRIHTTSRLTEGRLPMNLGDYTGLDSLPRFPWEYFWDESRRGLYSWDFQHDRSCYPVFTMNTTRGCPHACSFCQTRKIWGGRITHFSAERVLDDVAYCRSLGAKAIYFREDNFTSYEQRLIDICHGLIKDPIPWFCETRADTNLGLLRVMAAAGCKWVYVGVESLSQRMLDIYNKRLTVEQIMAFFARCRREGIKTYASMIVGHPDETAEDRAETSYRMQELRPDAHYFNQWRKT